MQTPHVSRFGRPVRASRVLSLLALAFALVGCQSAYYGAMEKMGVPKRDILSSRVKGTRDAQKSAQKEFTSALEQFRSVVNVPGSDLATQYAKLNSALQRSESQAKEVHDRIAGVESVSKALFNEWKAELEQYTNADLRERSARQLRDAQARYKELITAMKKAEARMDPVLQPLREQVMFLKHNLNAQAIGSLTDEVKAVQVKVDDLIRDTEASIKVADAFIATLSNP